jgi:soluble P-type ATPase
MLEIDVPGYKILRLEHLVLDYNGTLAGDGELLDGVDSALIELSRVMQVHILTGDTFGLAGENLAKMPCKLVILPAPHQDTQKLQYVDKLGPDACVTIGNGLNDRLMLRAAGLAIAVSQREGVAVETLMAADILVHDIRFAFELLTHPQRLIATLKS